MAISDPVADMLTRIRNAGKAKHDKVDVPASRMKTEIVKLLKAEGYVRNYRFVQDDKQGFLRVYLKNDALGLGRSGIVSISRISKPSRRVYCKAREISPVYSGMGIAILSTSHGVMTDKNARRKNLGGEILCTVW